MSSEQEGAPGRLERESRQVPCTVSAWLRPPQPPARICIYRIFKKPSLISEDQHQHRRAHKQTSKQTSKQAPLHPPARGLQLGCGSHPHLRHSGRRGSSSRSSSNEPQMRARLGEARRRGRPPHRSNLRSAGVQRQGEPSSSTQIYSQRYHGEHQHGPTGVRSLPERSLTGRQKPEVWREGGGGDEQGGVP